MTEHDTITDIPLDEPRSFFRGPVLDFWNRIVPPEMTAAEVEYLAATFATGKPVPHLLDVACGGGRHALGLARAGFAVTGIDIAGSELANLRGEAAAQRLAVNALEHDMRALSKLPETLQFDGAYCFGNAIAYLAPLEVADLLRALGERIHHGGLIVIESAMVAEAFLANYEERIELEAGGLHLVIDNEYEVSHSRVIGTYTFTDRTEERTTRRFAHWCLTTREMVDFAEAGGFDVEALLEDTEGAPFQLGSARLLMLARKR